jgi:hypothetical protein
MIKMANADTLDFCGFPYDVSAPLGLPPGWSWISYLPRDTMVVDDALGSLGANGEYIKNQTAFAEYIPDWSGWFGTLTDMCPGDGFKIRMAAADTLVYPDSVEVSGGKGTLRLPGAVGDDVCHWKVHPHEFETSGSVVAEVLKRGRKCTRPGDRLGAFCGDDCRGTAQAVVNPYGESMFYLTVYGGGAGEVLHFRYFESSTGLTRSISESVEFVEDMTLGRSTCPVVLAVSPEVPLDRTGYDGMFMLENSPDPFTLSTVLRFRLAEAGPLTLTIYNTCGQRVATLRDAYMETGTHEVVWDGMAESGRPAQDGVYFCRMRCADGLFTEKVILMR